MRYYCCSIVAVSHGPGNSVTFPRIGSRAKSASRARQEQYSDMSKFSSDRDKSLARAISSVPRPNLPRSVGARDQKSQSKEGQKGLATPPPFSNIESSIQRTHSTRKAIKALRPHELYRHKHRNVALSSSLPSKPHQAGPS
jgi:hypothetical protein